MNFQETFIFGKLFVWGGFRGTPTLGLKHMTARLSSDVGPQKLKIIASGFIAQVRELGSLLTNGRGWRLLKVLAQLILTFVSNLLFHVIS